jgi:hypothetical protein
MTEPERWHGCQGLKDRIKRESALFAAAHFENHGDIMSDNYAERVVAVRIAQAFITGAYRHCPYCGDKWGAHADS